ncbi:galactose oxidase [Gigaspora margarita]|uniref:Galactose oxidase n=1 Tax=Gigaspora margarita TaxID=4874 RepID=A0A8H4AHJ9_GIGMA|nr:galactose oxidase [Gigaspora margarita]
MKLFCYFSILLQNFQLFYVLVKAYTPTPRYAHSAALIGNKLYILGGDNDSPTTQFTPTKDFFYLDISVGFNTSNIPWTDLSNVVGTPKQSRAAVSAGGPNKDIIFLFGGGVENPSSDIPLVYTFDNLKNVWNTPTIKGIKPPRREYIKSVTDDTGKMYIFGGSYNIETGNSTWTFENRMDILDTIGLTWSIASQIQAPTPRDAFSATLLPNGIIANIGGYVVAGPTNLREISLYDTKNDVWETMTTVGTIPEVRAHHTSVLGLNNDRIIIYGGFSANKKIPIVHDLSVLDIRNKPYEWFIPNISGIIPPTPSRHTANIVGRYMIVTYGFIFSQEYINPSMYILDISDDSEYKWVKSFDPNSLPVSSLNPNPNSSSNSSPNQNEHSISTGTMIGVIIGTSLASILITMFALMVYRWYKKRNMHMQFQLMEIQNYRLIISNETRRLKC